MNRRWLIGGAAAGAAALAAGFGARRATESNMGGWSVTAESMDAEARNVTGMRYRDFGRSGIKISEVGFGAWGIGGKVYGAVPKSDALDALARAEELGCNFVDTATVYGDSELVIGEFLQGRRDKWLVATKFSGQDAGFEKTLEQQLQRLRVSHIDLYMIHWRPAEQELYEALYRIRKAGTARLVGVSLNTIEDIDYVLKQTDLDFFQVPFNLLNPDPFLAKLELIRAKRPGIIIRSTLQEGFLTGKYKRDATFTDPNDARSKWTPAQVAAAVDDAEQFRFLEQAAGSMLLGAARYPLSFAEVSTIIMGTKSAKQSDSNFGEVPRARLDDATLRRIEDVQRSMGRFQRKERLVAAIKGLFRG